MTEKIGNKKQGFLIESKMDQVATVGPVRFVAGPLFSETRLVMAGDRRKPGSSAESRPRVRVGFFQRGFPLREFSIKGFFGSSSPKSLV